MPLHEQDERLLVQAAQKDPGRFAELYDRHFERVYAYITRRVRSRAEAEDLTSEVFRRALEHLPRFELRGVPFGAWLFRIASNAIRDYLQRTARETGNPAADEPSAVPLGLEDVERRARLFDMVKELSGDQRSVVVMRFVQELSIREIAQAMGRSQGAVKQLQFRALQSLRARMSESDD